MKITTKNFEISLCDSFAGIREGFYWDGDNGQGFAIDGGMIIGYVPREVLEALYSNGFVY